MYPKCGLTTVLKARKNVIKHATPNFMREKSKYIGLGLVGLNAYELSLQPSLHTYDVPDMYYMY